MLKPILIVPGLLVFALSSRQPAASSAQPPTTRSAPVRPTSESMVHVKKVYGYDCAMCHGDTGNGKGDVAADMKLTLKDYTDPAALQDLTDAQIFDIVKNGKGQMPGEGPRLKDDDVWTMVVVLRSFSKK